MIHSFDIVENNARARWNRALIPQCKIIQGVDVQAGRSGRRRHADRMVMLAQPQCERDERDAEHDRIGGDGPDQAERAGARSDHHDDAEQHGQDAAQDQHPLIVDLLAQLDRANDLEDAVHQRPGSDEEDQQDRGDAGPEERDDAGGDAEQPDHDQPPGRNRLGAAGERRDQ